MWEWIFEILVYLFAVVGLMFVASGVTILIADWLSDLKKKRAFGKAALRNQAIKEAKLEVLNDIRGHCENSRIVCGDSYTNHVYKSGMLAGVQIISDYVEKYYATVKEGNV